MTLNETPAIAHALGGKAAGHLIQARDWNGVAEMLELFGAALVAQQASVAGLESAVSALTARVSALEDLPARVATLAKRAAPLLENYLVEVATNEADYLVGEIAEITVSVRTLDGGAIAGTPPWVDVFATWGRLRAAPGFASRDNAEENAISVQVDAAGIARVQLRSQFTKGFDVRDEMQFAKLLHAPVGSAGKTVKQVFAQSATPTDGPVKAALKTIASSYQSSATSQRYLDSYVGLATAGKYTLDKFRRTGEWEDYRATVMFFAKPNADPVSPDPARGIGTIQVNFREWVTNWVDDYWSDLGDLSTSIGQLVLPHFDKDDIVKNSILELDKLNRTSGVLGQTRNGLAFKQAIDRVNAGVDPVRQQAKSLLDGAMKLQLNAGAGAATEVALGYAAQAQASLQATRQATAAQAQATQAQGVKQAVDVLEGRMKAAEETGRTIHSSLTRIGDGVNKINVVEVADLGSRLQKINADLSALAVKVGR